MRQTDHFTCSINCTSPAPIFPFLLASSRAKILLHLCVKAGDAMVRRDQERRKIKIKKKGTWGKSGVHEQKWQYLFMSRHFLFHFIIYLCHKRRSDPTFPRAHVKKLKKKKKGRTSCRKVGNYFLFEN